MVTAGRGMMLLLGVLLVFGLGLAAHVPEYARRGIRDRRGLDSSACRRVDVM